MSYRMIYEPGSRAEGGNSVIFRTLMTASFFVCFLWTVSRFWPEGRELLKLLLIPGDPDMTLEAIEVFAQELGCGYPIKDAVQNFFDAVL